MDISTEIEITVGPREKYMLWGIFHHHITLPQLDEEETEFRVQLLHLLDPMKEMEAKYTSEVQKRASQNRR
tara:strand:+ start:6557 stop:6769 length:213 start_codon:yes stop_codon:yes gene_type:complete